MWIHINNLLAVSLTILCLRLLHNSQKYNFFVFGVVYKTEKSKVMVKILVATNAKSLFNTTRRRSRPSFLSAVFAARAVLK